MPYVLRIPQEEIKNVTNGVTVANQAKAAGFKEYLRGDDIWCPLDQFGTPGCKYYFAADKKQIYMMLSAGVILGEWPLR